MSTLHLSKGSQEPPKTDGKIRIYSMQFCPFAQRTRLVLQAKNIPHEVVNIDLINKPEWYFKIHPEGKVPALDTGSEIILDSLKIAEYLDEKYTNNPLYPKDAAAKKQDQDVIKKIDPLIGTFYKCIVGPVRQSVEEWAKEFSPHLGALEAELTSRGTTYFGGEKPGMVDYMLWPWGQRAQVVAIKLGQKLPYDEGQFSVLRRWSQAMKKDPACVATYTKPEDYWNFIQKSLAK